MPTTITQHEYLEQARAFRALVSIRGYENICGALATEWYRRVDTVNDAMIAMISMATGFPLIPTISFIYS
jgi:hypothetical protein